MDNQITPESVQNQNQVPPQQPVNQEPQEAPTAFNQVPQQPVNPVTDNTNAPIAPQPEQPVNPEPQPEQPPVQEAPVEEPAPVKQQETQQAQPTKTPFVLAPKQHRVVDDAEGYIKAAPNQKAEHPMKAILDAQPKVMTIVPLQPGEKEDTWHPVGINGYFMYIKKNVMMPVPEQVAKMIAKSFNLTHAAGREYLITDDNPDKKSALS